ncbi:hypothetical protein B7P43_G17794 [Cryptotermes secundus]|nr:uncharacterized protein LOC111864091 isoform X3 [Cryptotermes secundus]PNF43133.1 hypothetical protein B7P43_G17794 [Cryptotermes secundus]
MNKYADRQSFSRQKSITSVSSSLGTSYGSATETSVADVGKRKPCGYLTLLDISMLGGFSIPESSILPDTEFVPNSFHQQSHLSRWRSFVNETPKWIMKMGIEGLNKQRNSRNKRAQILNKKEHLKNKEKSDHWFQKTICDEGNKVHNNENKQECTTENSEVEKGFQNERNEIIREGDEVNVYTKEWRDWSLQLTGNGSLVITGKVDNNVISRSADVSLCKRLDAHTLKLSGGSIYKLVGMPDHFTNLPCYVRNKFQCGFPDDWKEVKLMWKKYIMQGSPCHFSWTCESTSECRENSTMQKNKISTETSSPVEERGGAEVPSQALNSMVQSFSANQSQSIAVKSVGKSHLKSTVHQQHGKQCDCKEVEVRVKQLNSTMIQEGDKQLDVDGTEMCVIQPSSTTVQESLKQSNFREMKVCLTRISTAVQKYGRQSGVKATKVRLKQPTFNIVEECDKQSNDIEVTLVDPPNSVPVTKKVLSQSLTNCGTSDGHSCTPVNTVLNAAETSALLNLHVLHRWAPVLIKPGKLKLTGYLQSTCSSEAFHTTGIVVRRKDFDCFVCHDGTAYKLQGPFEDHKHNIPSPIQKLLHEGLPYKWKMMIRKWARLLNVVNGQEKEAKQKKETTSVTSQADRIESTKHIAGYDESFVAETVTANDVSASDENSSLNEGAVEKQTYRAGSLIPLKKLDGRGIIQTSSRGRLVVPPVRYWLGERLVQQNDQPTFFSPRAGVTKVIVNQSFASSGSQKKRKHSTPEAATLPLSKRRHARHITTHVKKSKLGTPKEEGAVMSHSPQSDQKQKAIMKAWQTRRAIEGKYNARQKRLMLNGKEKYMQICESGETLSDGTFTEAKEDRVLSKMEHKSKRPAYKSASASWCTKTGARKTKNYSLRSQKNGGLNNAKEFRGETLKKKRNFSPPSHIYDSEEDLLDGYGDDVLADLVSYNEISWAICIKMISVNVVT